MSDNVADRAFVDTNVLVYTISTEPEKQRISRTLVVQVPEVVVSAQVLSEFKNACLRPETALRVLLVGQRDAVGGAGCGM